MSGDTVFLNRHSFINLIFSDHWLEEQLLIFQHLSTTVSFLYRLEQKIDIQYQDPGDDSAFINSFSNSFSTSFKLIFSSMPMILIFSFFLKKVGNVFNQFIFWVRREFMHRHRKVTHSPNIFKHPIVVISIFSYTLFIKFQHDLFHFEQTTTDIFKIQGETE